jgi:hypothetical protein
MNDETPTHEPARSPSRAAVQIVEESRQVQEEPLSAEPTFVCWEGGARAAVRGAAALNAREEFGDAAGVPGGGSVHAAVPPKRLWGWKVVAYASRVDAAKDALAGWPAGRASRPTSPPGARGATRRELGQT